MADQYKRVTLSLPPQLVEKLDRLAHDTHRNRSNFVARLIERQPEPTR